MSPRICKIDLIAICELTSHSDAPPTGFPQVFSNYVLYKYENSVILYKLKKKKKKKSKQTSHDAMSSPFK
jgi:hypothetical protein